MSKRELETLETKVMNVLITSPMARDSDKVLFYDYIKMYCPEVMNLRFGEAMHEIPNYESLGRVRRKLQSMYPEIRSTRQIEKMREQREEEFREYARI